MIEQCRSSAHTLFLLLAHFVRSYKFLRHFPLSQTDLPTPQAGILEILDHTSSSFEQSSLYNSNTYFGARPQQALTQAIPPTPDGASNNKPLTSRVSRAGLSMSDQLLARNPEVDYTPPELISSVISDAGILTPSAVSQFLVNMWNDEL